MKNIVNNTYHTMIVRTTFSRALPELIPDIVDEFNAAFEEEIKVGNGYIFMSAAYSRLGTRASSLRHSFKVSRKGG